MASRRPTWSSYAGLAAAGLVALALTITVVAPYRALNAAASQALVSGESETFARPIIIHLLTIQRIPSPESWERMVQAYSQAGLRYAAIVQGPFIWSQAGTATMPVAGPKQAEEIRIRGLRVQRVVRFPSGPVNHPVPGTYLSGPRPPPPEGQRGNWGVVFEYDPPGYARLKAAMNRTVGVGALAALVLAAVAVALTRRAVRRGALDREAEQQERLAALGRMSSVMAHELRNPLASLKGHAQLLLETIPPGTDEHDKAERVVANASRLERLIRDLLDFVQDRALDRRAVPPAEMLGRAIEGLPRPRLDLDVSGAPELLRVDEARIATALGNLLRNALQASAPEDAVGVRISRTGDDVVIEVRDRGPGLPVGEEQRIFEPFVTHKLSGTGLGLAAARRAVEQHGGTLVGANHPSGGAVFRIVLPRSVEGA